MARSLTALSLALICSTLAPHAFADWQGTMTMTSKELKQPLKGKIAAKGTKLRFDMNEGGQSISTITDTKTAKSVMLMHAQKMKMETAYDAAKSGVMCSTSDIDACFAKNKYKKTGSATVNGQPCDIYEGVQTTPDKKRVQQKIWRPTKLKEVAMVRAVSRLEDGKTFTIDVTDIKQGSLPDSTFVAPKDYSAMPDMSQMMKGMKLPKFGK